MGGLKSGGHLRLDGKFGAHAVFAIAIGAALGATMTGETANAAATLDHGQYGTTQGGQAVDIFTMTNEHGMRVRFLSYGGVITAIEVPDRAGRLDDIVLGLKTLREYETISAHYGAITGASPIVLAARNSRWTARPTISSQTTAPTRFMAVLTHSIVRFGR